MSSRVVALTVRQAAPGQLLLFVPLAAVALALSINAAAAVGGSIGIRTPVASMALVSAIFSAFLLAVSAQLLRWQGNSLRALGLPTDLERIKRLGVGFVVTAILFLGVIRVQSAAVNAEWIFQGSGAIKVAALGIALVACMVLAEELLFRGIVLRAFQQMYGDRAAMLLSALLFGAYHVVQSQDWAMGAVFLFATSALGGLLFAWAAIRSGGLALPIGLHLGGNWVQASVVTFHPLSASGGTPIVSVWHVGITADDVRRLSAPDVVPHLPYFVAVLCAALLVGHALRPRITSSLPQHQ